MPLRILFHHLRNLYPNGNNYNNGTYYADDGTPKYSISIHLNLLAVRDAASLQRLAANTQLPR